MMRVGAVLRAAGAAGRRAIALSFWFLREYGILFYDATLAHLENTNV